MKITLVLILLTLGMENIHAQMTGVYKSDAGTDYFPILLCFIDDWEFIYLEEMDKNHVNSIYIEKGFYKIQNDTLLFNVEHVGFNNTPMSKESFLKKATIDDNKIKMLNDFGEVYGELKRTKKRKKKKVLRECERIRLIANQ